MQDAATIGIQKTGLERLISDFAHPQKTKNLG